MHETRDGSKGFACQNCFAARRNLAKLRRMSFDTLKKEVESLAQEERRKLIAYMVVLEDHGQPGYREKLARKIQDRAPQNWLTPEQCERELGLADEAP